MEGEFWKNLPLATFIRIITYMAKSLQPQYNKKLKVVRFASLDLSPISIFISIMNCSFIVRVCKFELVNELFGLVRLPGSSP